MSTNKLKHAEKISNIKTSGVKTNQDLDLGDISGDVLPVPDAKLPHWTVT